MACKKRKTDSNFMDCDMAENNSNVIETSKLDDMLSFRPCCKCLLSSRFLHFPVMDGVYSAENMKSLEETVFCPLPLEILINISNVDEITFQKGTCFLGDKSGQYEGQKEGDVIQFWKYSPVGQRYVSKAILLTNKEIFENLKHKLVNN